MWNSKQSNYVYAPPTFKGHDTQLIIALVHLDKECFEIMFMLALQLNQQISCNSWLELGFIKYHKLADTGD